MKRSVFLKRFAGIIATAPLIARSIAAEPALMAPAATAINALGADLLGRAVPEGNALLSPYSIQSALAMTYAGAAGGTREEMVQVLHFAGAENDLHASFAAVNRGLAAAAAEAPKFASEFGSAGGRDAAPLVVNTANRLFGQRGFEFRQPFLARMRDTYQAPLEVLDFASDPAAAAGKINGWVEEQTRDRIPNLIAPGILDATTRLVLVNAIYFKAPWADEFSRGATQPRAFHVAGRELRNVPTMRRKGHLGYARREGYQVVAIPYFGHDLQFTIWLPDAVDGVNALAAALTARGLIEAVALPSRQLVLDLPKFKLEPAALRLGEALRKLGLRSAFDIPFGSADFDRMASRRGSERLAISEVIHKAFLSLDEKGTEAAAATAVTVAPTAAPIRERPKPIEVKVDRPFLFAVQDRNSGACLFLGRMVDPR